jgi:methyltransferase-like protein/SAM-dependent methyltransferase
MTDTLTPYDQLLYPEAAFAQSHPDRLAMLAILLGMTPAPVERCRVLELGCGTGGNLIPMAYQYPESAFFGIDYAARQIAVADETTAALGLNNIVFAPFNFLDVTDDMLGEFDYIIAHGIYSWVPSDVQAKMLDICKKHLAPQGVAYISYNTLPGWRLYGMGREMMMYRVRKLTDLSERSQTAREFLRFIAGLPRALERETSWAKFMSAFDIVLKSQNEYLDTKPDSSFVHDELEYNNEALYFHEFNERIEAAGLQFLAESLFPSSVINNLPMEIQKYLADAVSDVIEIEQYLDFFRNRTFRQTLLVHDDILIERRLRAERVAKLLLVSPAKVGIPDADEAKPGAEKFIASDNETSFVTTDPLTIAAFQLLIEAYPQEYTLEDLTTTAREKAYPFKVPPRTLQQDIELIGNHALQTMTRSYAMMEFRASRTPMVREVSERPIASTIARYQVLRGDAMVTSQRHERVSLDATARHLIPLMNGSRTKQDLVDALRESAVMPRNIPRFELDNGLTKEVDDVLKWMAYSALLVGSDS